MKKIVTVVVLTMLLCMMGAVHASAMEPEWYIDDSGTMIGYVGQEAQVVVPDTIDGKQVTGIGRSAFRSNAAIEQVTLPDGVISLGDHAFYACENLKSITIPDSVRTIGEGTFGKCRSLTELTLSASLDTFDALSMHFCTALTSVTIPEENEVFASVDGVVFSKDMTMLIYYPPAKADAVYTVPDGVNTIVTGAFEDSVQIEELVLPRSVQYIDEQAFLRCDALRTVTYCGSEDAWQSVEVGEDNAPITAAEMAFDAGSPVGVWVAIGVVAAVLLVVVIVLVLKSRRK